MPRILWFALGVLAGTAYSSSLIHRERLDRSPGEAAIDVEAPEAQEGAVDTRAMKEKLADRLEEGVIRISGFLEEKAAMLEEKAHDLADALRGTAAPIDLDGRATKAAQTPVLAGASMAAPIATKATAFGEPDHSAFGTTAHEVLESPFPQTDPALPAAPILQHPDGKPPVMLDVTSDQGLEGTR